LLAFAGKLRPRRINTQPFESHRMAWPASAPAGNRPRRPAPGMPWHGGGGALGRRARHDSGTATQSTSGIGTESHGGGGGAASLSQPARGQHGRGRHGRAVDSQSSRTSPSPPLSPSENMGGAPNSGRSSSSSAPVDNNDKNRISWLRFPCDYSIHFSLFGSDREQCTVDTACAVVVHACLQWGGVVQRPNLARQPKI
jgi:hypothetical protein